MYGIFAEETQDIIRIAAVEKAPHEVVLTWDGHSGRCIRAADGVVEKKPQGIGHHLIGIYHQYPLVLCRINGILAGRFHNATIALDKRNHTASRLTGNGTGVVGALHIAHHNLIELLHGSKDLRQVTGCVECVDDYGNLLHDSK